MGPFTKLCHREGNTAKIIGIPYYDDRIDEYVLRPVDQLVVCWECKASYNDEGDDETNKYLSKQTKE